LVTFTVGWLRYVYTPFAFTLRLRLRVLHAHTVTYLRLPFVGLVAFTVVAFVTLFVLPVTLHTFTRYGWLRLPPVTVTVTFGCWLGYTRYRLRLPVAFTRGLLYTHVCYRLPTRFGYALHGYVPVVYVAVTVTRLRLRLVLHVYTRLHVYRLRCTRFTLLHVLRLGYARLPVTYVLSFARSRTHTRYTCTRGWLFYTRTRLRFTFGYGLRSRFTFVGCLILVTARTHTVTTRYACHTHVVHVTVYVRLRLHRTHHTFTAHTVVTTVTLHYGFYVTFGLRYVYGYGYGFGYVTTFTFAFTFVGCLRYVAFVPLVGWLPPRCLRLVTLLPFGSHRLRSGYPLVYAHTHVAVTFATRLHFVWFVTHTRYGLFVTVGLHHGYYVTHVRYVTHFTVTFTFTLRLDWLHCRLRYVTFTLRLLRYVCLRYRTLFTLFTLHVVTVYVYVWFYTAFVTVTTRFAPGYLLLRLFTLFCYRLRYVGWLHIYVTVALVVYTRLRLRCAHTHGYTRVAVATRCRLR